MVDFHNSDGDILVNNLNYHTSENFHGRKVVVIISEKMFALVCELAKFMNYSICYIQYSIHTSDYYYIYRLKIKKIKIYRLHTRSLSHIVTTYKRSHIVTTYKRYRGYCTHTAVMRTDRSVIMATTESAETHPAVKDR